MGFGVLEGWSSPSTILLTSDETPMPFGKISMDEVSWIVALPALGCLLGSICFGFITNIFGRKVPLIIITVPMIISWSLILFARNVFYLYASRFMGGFFGGGAYIITPLFLSEIANDR